MTIMIEDTRHSVGCGWVVFWVLNHLSEALEANVRVYHTADACMHSFVLQIQTLSGLTC